MVEGFVLDAEVIDVAHIDERAVQQVAAQVFGDLRRRDVGDRHAAEGFDHVRLHRAGDADAFAFEVVQFGDGCLAVDEVGAGLQGTQDDEVVQPADVAFFDHFQGDEAGVAVVFGEVGQLEDVNAGDAAGVVRHRDFRRVGNAVLYQAHLRFRARAEGAAEVVFDAERAAGFGFEFGFDFRQGHGVVAGSRGEEARVFQRLRFGEGGEAEADEGGEEQFFHGVVPVNGC